MTPPNLAPARSSRDSGHVGSLALRFADATGRTPQSGSQRLSGKGRLDADAATFLRICKDDGRRAEMEAFMRPLLALYNDVEPEPFTPALLTEKAVVDANENAALAQFQVDMLDGLNHDELARYTKDVRAEMVSVLRLYDSLVAEGRRRGRS